MNNVAIAFIYGAVPFLLVTGAAKLSAFICARTKLGWGSSLLFAALTLLLSGIGRAALRSFPSTPTAVAVALAGVLFASAGAIFFPRRATDAAEAALSPMRGAMIGGLSWALLLVAGFLLVVVVGFADAL